MVAILVYTETAEVRFLYPYIYVKIEKVRHQKNPIKSKTSQGYDSLLHDDNNETWGNGYYAWTVFGELWRSDERKEPK